MRNRLLPLAGLVAVGLVAASCSSSSSSSSAGSPAAASLLSATQSAVQKAGSVSFVDVTTIGKRSETLTGHVGTSQAEEVLTVAKSPVLQVRLIGTTVYIETTASSVLQSALGLTASEAAGAVGEWIELIPSDSPTAAIAQSLTVNAALNIYYPKSSSATELPAKSIAGVTVIPVTSNSAPNKTTTETTTLFVQKSTKLPVAASLVAVSGKTTEKKRAVFTSWGQAISVVAPANAVLFSTIKG